MKFVKFISAHILPMMIFSLIISSCDNGTSYAELLDEETKAVNAFLANERVINEIPEDSVFEVGEDAPYYKMDADGNVYMQVLNAGTKNNKAQSDQLIYFRFMRYNLNYWSIDAELVGEGNADDMEYIATSFRFGNYTLSSSSQWGSGIQLPLYYLGVDCEVNLVIKSQYGLSNEISNVIPYLYNIRYFKSQI